MQTDPLYISPPVGSVKASVWDLTSVDGLPAGLEPSSVDIVVLVFVLSALHPYEWSRAVANIYKMLKPGGLVVLRDYGRYDLTQLRFKGRRLLEENLYVRGDKTRVYFFELDELSLLFTGHRAFKGQTTEFTTSELVESVDDLETPDTQNITALGSETNDKLAPSVIDLEPRLKSIHPVLLSPNSELQENSRFTIDQLGVDRRLLVNRKRQLKMYRVWVQGKFRKCL